MTHKDIPDVDQTRELAWLCSRLFLKEGSFGGFQVDTVDCIGKPVLAVAVELRALLAKTSDGRKALADLGFQPFLDQLERE